MNSILNILHLEDDPADARLVKDTLREEGLDVELTLASDRPKFLAALNRGLTEALRTADRRLMQLTDEHHEGDEWHGAPTVAP